MPHRLQRIETSEDIAKGCRSLRRRCAVMRRILDRTGSPPLRRHPAGFPGLARIIVGQQLSIASATAIWSRLETGVVPFTATAILSLDEADLKTHGLSRPKIATLRRLAEAANDGRLDFDELDRMDPQAIHERLTAIGGIGPWTADIYILFCLGHRDAFASGDLALREAVCRAGLAATRPSPEELQELAMRWRPWRGVAARLLWAFYALKPEPGES